MNIRLFIFYCLLCSGSISGVDLEKVHYKLRKAPIDVVIPSVEKDLATLEMCIEGVKANVVGIRRVIVVSSHKLTDKAEWFDEKNYPFSRYDIAFEIFKDRETAMQYTNGPSRLGWIYQQLLKMYAPFVIPGISQNVLIVDSDTIFLRLVHFLGVSGEGLYNPGTEFHPPYFSHMNRLLPGLIKLYPHYSGISHHMLFQKEVLEDLFQLIEKYHSTEVWRAMCRSIDLACVDASSMSEYEIYFNFVFKRTDQMKIRPLRWENISLLSDIHVGKKNGYDYVSCHSFLRK